MTKNPILTLLQLAWLALLGLSLIPSGAHFFEFPGKMALAPQAYMETQTIYAGWAYFGIVIIFSAVLAIVHGLLMPPNSRARWLSWACFIAVIAGHLVFWRFTYPMNALTANWTLMPPDLEAVRRQWEYSHLWNAVISFAAFLAGASAVIASVPTQTSN